MNTVTVTLWLLAIAGLYAGLIVKNKVDKAVCFFGSALCAVIAALLTFGN